MLDKIIKVVKMKDCTDCAVDAFVIIYQDGASEYLSPQVDNIPQLQCRVEKQTYFRNDTDPNIPYEDVLPRLFYAADKRTGPKEALPELVMLADNEIYDATKRWISNTIICNDNTKKYAEALVKQGINKNIIISNDINDGWLLLMLVPDDQLSYAAVAVKNEKDIIVKLDIINPCLLKSIKIEGDLK